jgi:hypothetical protein
VNLSLLASEGIRDPDLWYPTLLGFLVVVAAVALFCGSVYMLLATNLGAKLGFLVAVGGLSGFMVLLSALWLTTASPLNTLKGRVPEWSAVEVIGPDLARSTVPEVAEITEDTPQLDTAGATNVKAAVDGTIVTQEPEHGEELAPDTNEFAQFQEATDYLVTDTYEVGGGGRFDVRFDGTFPWVHMSFHKPKYAVATVCPVLEVEVPFGDPIPPAECDPDQESSNVIFERDLGSLRMPPLVVLIASSIVFVLSLLGLHWRERDLAAAAEAGEQSPGPRTPGPTPADGSAKVPANV